MKRFPYLFGVITLITLSNGFAASDITAPVTGEKAPKNIIMIVADGMGPVYTTAYRNFADNPKTETVEPVVFDQILVGRASTYPAAESGYITDSAAAATALASGIKTYNGAIGVDVNKQPVPSVLHQAKRLGKRTGVAVTSQVNHATPAAYIAHNESRQNYDQLADSFFDHRIDKKIVADVMLGGGTRYFKRQDRDLVTEFTNAGYQFAKRYSELAEIEDGANVLGLFADVGLPAALDDTEPHRLALLTREAIRFLENPKGFFLLVEASQVDWAGHSNDIASAMAEMDDLAQTLIYLKGYVERHPDTLVVLTADHNTGGLSLGAHGNYQWNPVPIQNMMASVATIAQGIQDAIEPLQYVSSKLGYELSAGQQKSLEQVLTEDPETRQRTLKKMIDTLTHTGWTTTGHTGVDVQVFAFGQQSERFAGQIDNTDIAKKLFSLLQREDK